MANVTRNIAVENERKICSKLNAYQNAKRKRLSSFVYVWRHNTKTERPSFVPLFQWEKLIFFNGFCALALLLPF